jgi:DNA mismatch repair protein MutL
VFNSSGSIRRLAPSEIASIRAGEVVVRPASVIKELVENAIDAGATGIDVLIAAGGLGRIIVIDDGRGMSNEDLLVVGSPHSTSKFRESLSDLDTLGFRGEAIYSIVAAARSVQIRSRSRSDDHGWSVVVTGPDARSPLRPAAGPPGTAVEVEGLFSAMPARLAMMKSAAVEAKRCVEVVRALALGLPEVTFRVFVEGRPVLSVDRTTSASKRMMDVLAVSDENRLLEGRAVEKGAVVDLVVTSPSISVANQSGIYVYCNGRWVPEHGFGSIIKSALQGIFPSGRFPQAVIDIRVPPEDIDPNVHASKSAILLKQESVIQRLVTSAIRSALSGGGSLALGELGAVAATMFRSADGIVRDQSERPLGVPVGVIGGVYIVSITDNGVVIVDAHAAHERIVYERFLREPVIFSTSRILESSLSVRVSPDLEPVLMAIADELAHVGIGVVVAGDGLCHLTAVPEWVPSSDVPSILEAITDGSVGDVVDRLRRRLATISCRMSFRRGDGLTLDFARTLLRQMEDCPQSGRCVHGRPTIVRLENADFSRIFGRS